MRKGTHHYKDMLIAEGRKPLWYVGRNGKMKCDYEPIFTIYEMGNFVDTAPTLDEAKAKVDKIREEEI